MAFNFEYTEAMHSLTNKVSYELRPSRDGQRYKLTMKVEVDGSLSQEDAVAHATRILQARLHMPAKPNPYEFSALLRKEVSELNLQCRPANCLKYNDIIYIGDLVQMTEVELLRTPNFGLKSLMEVKYRLADMGLHLGMELKDWPPQGINPENI